MRKQIATKRGGFTLVEIMLVVAIIALLASIAVPGFLRSRKRSQAAKILNDLRMIDSAVSQYAIENSKSAGDPVAVSDWTSFLKKDTLLYNTGMDVFGESYGPQTVDTIPQVPPIAANNFSDITDAAFWSPYGP